MRNQTFRIALAKVVVALDGSAVVIVLCSLTSRKPSSTWLLGWLVTLQANQIAFLEALIALWLVAGYRLQFGWFFTSLVLVSLVFGNQVAMNFPAASGDTDYIIVVCIGIYVSRFDRFVLGRKPSAA